MPVGFTSTFWVPGPGLVLAQEPGWLRACLATQSSQPTDPGVEDRGGLW